MPSRAKVPFQVRFKVLKNLPIFHQNGELKPEKNYVWTRAKRNLKKLHHTIEIHNLYISVLQNRNTLLSALREKAEVAETNKKDFNRFSSDESGEETSDTEEESCDSDEEFDVDGLSIANKNPHNCPPLNFRFYLNPIEYGKVQPIEVSYKNSRYPVSRLNYGWTDIFARKIYSTTKLKCCFSFKKQTVYQCLDRPLFSFYGHCRECGTFIYGFCDRQFSDGTNNAVIHIKTFDTSGILHKGKRFLKGKPLKRARKTLKYVKASRYRTLVADKFFQFGDPEPADLQTTVTLRKARQRAIEKELDIKGPKDVYSSLIYMSETPNSSIRHLQAYPFVLKFHTDNQITVWNNIAKKGRLCISMDASGSFVKQLRTPTHETNYILYYAAVTILDNKIVPLQQMVSEKHDTNTIKKWLTDGIRDGAPFPDEATTDGSLALLGAASLAYNKCTYRRYLEIGFQYSLDQMLGKPSEIQLPRTWIRQDRAHVIKASARWGCFKKVSYSTKDIYLRIIGYSLEIESLQLLGDVLFAIFILSETMYIVPGSECERQLNWIMDKIKTFDRNDVHQVLQEPTEADSKVLNFQNEDEFKDIVTENCINGFIKAIHQKAKSNCINEITDGAMSNMLRCPDIKDNIFYLYVQAPAWTNLLRKAYNSPNIKAISAGSEANFKNLKALDFITYPISANKFFKNLEQQIEATIAFAQSRIMDNETEEIECAKSQPKSKIPIQAKNFTTTTIKSQSTTNGASKESTSNHKKLKNENYQKIDDKNQNAMSVSGSHDVMDVIIINGNNKIHPVMIQENGQKKLYYTTNTCPVDSISEIFSFSYETLERFQRLVKDRSNNDYLRVIKSYCERNFCKTFIYQERARLMKSLPTTEITGSTINCVYNVSDLLEKFFSDRPLIRRTVSCTNCDFIRIDEYSTAIIPVSEVNNFQNQGMDSLQRYLNLHFCRGNTFCSRCKTPNRINRYVVDSLLLVNLEYLFLNNGKVNNANGIPPSLHVQKTNYKLSGVVAFMDLSRPKLSLRSRLPPQTVPDLHYYAYLLKNGTWERRNDMVNQIEPLKFLPSDVKISVAVYVADFS